MGLGKTSGIVIDKQEATDDKPEEYWLIVTGVVIPISHHKAQMIMSRAGIATEVTNPEPGFYRYIY